MPQCKEQVQAQKEGSLWSCLNDAEHPGPHRFDQQYYREELADLRAQLRQAQEERDAAIEQNKCIVAWACQFIEKRGTVVFTGLSVPKRVLDEARAEHAARCKELTERAEAAEALAEWRGKELAAAAVSFKHQNKGWCAYCSYKASIKATPAEAQARREAE